jgi:signal transduction histidine kinase
MWKNTQELVNSIQREPWAKKIKDHGQVWASFTQWVESALLPQFLAQLFTHVEDIVGIDSDLPEPRILELFTSHVVEFLGAHSARSRIYDPETEGLYFYGAYPSKEEGEPDFWEKSISAEVVSTEQTRCMANLSDYLPPRERKELEARGIFSLMAVPLAIPRFFAHDPEMVGVIFIFYPEKDRTFSTLEIELAEVMAHRLGFVMARKKIFTLYKLNEKKEAIIRKVFLEVGAREGIKMKEVFNRVIPELADIINVQSCVLFSVTEDREQVILEAGYPEGQGHHGIGRRIPIASEPVFQRILNRGAEVHETGRDMITPSYILVGDPQGSPLLSDNLRRFAAAHNINSILYVPLAWGDEVNHFIAFDALEQRQRYTEDEIEILLFLGRELMTAQRIERLDDILHDFKNPAIATAGFARRLKHLLELENQQAIHPNVKKYVDILLEETARLQELALSELRVGKEQVISLTDYVRRRFEINKEAIKELGKENVTLKEGSFHDPLYVECYPLHLERVMDNLLNNATKAIPPSGGILSVRTYLEKGWACVEITNTGRISEEERLRLMHGEGRGRGLLITRRIVHLMKGKVGVKVGPDTTTFIVRLPAAETVEGMEGLFEDASLPQPKPEP